MQSRERLRGQSARVRASLTLTLQRVDATNIGALIALYERAVGLYASLININAYHQPGVEAGKKAATQFLAMQQMLIKVLREAAQALLAGHDAVFYPAEDGGYVLVGLRRPQPALFERMTWSTSAVMNDTRARAQAQRLAVREFDPLWDVDLPDDLTRLRAWVADPA